MYEKIDELIAAILKSEEFINYHQAQCQLYQSETMALLSKYQSLMEDYLKIRDYSMDVGQKTLKKQIQNIQREINQHPDIQCYYQAYYQFNDLLEEVTQIVFENISCNLKLERFRL